MTNEQVLSSTRLRKIAEKYFNNPSSITSEYGICFNMDEEFGEQSGLYCWYKQMSEVMHELKYRSYFETEAGDDQLLDTEQWQSRAWMCLFLAEYLETK